MSFHFPAYLYMMENIKAGSKEYRKERYKKNKQKINESCKKWYQDNREYIKAKQKERYYKSSDEVKAEWALAKRNKNAKTRAFIKEYKNSCSCKKCSESRNYVLDFHHLDPLQKDFNLGDAVKYSLKKIENELEKCIVLCRNCHSEFHYFEKENGMKIEEYLKN
jgi:Zn finger protein HypA/HybF involved in hydrogenase expression